MKDAAVIMRFMFKRETVNGNPSKLVVLHYDQPGTEGMILFRQYVLLTTERKSMKDENFVLVKKFSSGGQDRFLYQREFPIRFVTLAIFAHFFKGNEKTPMGFEMVHEN
jgi:hypothetical protein